MRLDAKAICPFPPPIGVGEIISIGTDVFVETGIGVLVATKAINVNVGNGLILVNAGMVTMAVGVGSSCTIVTVSAAGNFVNMEIATVGGTGKNGNAKRRSGDKRSGAKYVTPAKPPIIKISKNQISVNLRRLSWSFFFLRGATKGFSVS